MPVWPHAELCSRAPFLPRELMQFQQVPDTTRHTYLCPSHQPIGYTCLPCPALNLCPTRVHMEGEEGHPSGTYQFPYEHSYLCLGASPASETKQKQVRPRHPTIIKNRVQIGLTHAPPSPCFLFCAKSQREQKKVLHFHLTWQD